MEKIIVESFTMDHTKVCAPFARKSSRIEAPKGDIITKFDLRFTQPNREIMPTGAVHALEHLMAGFIREELIDVIDLSPMGCRTGFYLILIGDRQEEEIVKAWINTLDKVLLSMKVPAANQLQCGNYRDLSLFGAKEFARKVATKLKNKYKVKEEK